MKAVIDSFTRGVPAALIETRRLGWSLRERAADILAFFDRPCTSNGPTEALECQVRHKTSPGDSSISAAPCSGSGTQVTI